MTLTEINTALTALDQHAVQSIAKKQVSLTEVIGMYELHKSDLISWAQRAAMAEAQKSAMIQNAIKHNFENGGRG